MGSLRLAQLGRCPPQHTPPGRFGLHFWLPSINFRGSYSRTHGNHTCSHDTFDHFDSYTQCNSGIHDQHFCFYTVTIPHFPPDTRHDEHTFCLARSSPHMPHPCGHPSGYAGLTARSARCQHTMPADSRPLSSMPTILPCQRLRNPLPLSPMSPTFWSPGQHSTPLSHMHHRGRSHVGSLRQDYGPVCSGSHLLSYSHVSTNHSASISVHHSILLSGIPKQRPYSFGLPHNTS
jgi:hypothetical protein